MELSAGGEPRRDRTRSARSLCGHGCFHMFAYQVDCEGVRTTCWLWTDRNALRLADTLRIGPSCFCWLHLLHPQWAKRQQSLYLNALRIAVSNIIHLASEPVQSLNFRATLERHGFKSHDSGPCQASV